MPATLLQAALLAAAVATPAARPNVLLITVDTLRPDALSWAGGKNATPGIDALAREAFRFPGAVAPAPLTLPSHATMLTGFLPVHHGVHDNGRVLAGAVPTLAEMLRKAGYATGAVISGYPLRSMFGLDRGFEAYDELLVANGRATTERPANETTQAALAWIRSARRSDRPWFLWVHYFDAHDPYDPPQGFRRPGPRGAYDGEVAFVDSAILELRKGAAKLDTGSTLTVFSGDHGESLGEHGEATHGFFVYDATVVVPLVFSLPARVKPGTSAAAARLVDVTPTILDLVGLAVPKGLDGVSLRATLEGRPQQFPAAYVESQYAWLAYGWSPLSALRKGGWKLVRAPRPELYDLAHDPGETKDLAAERPDLVRRLAEELRAAESAPSLSAPASADPAAASGLRSLGYLSGGVSPATPPASGLPDPKDLLEEKALLEEAEGLYQRGDERAAYQAFRTILGVEPGNRLALMRTGMILARGEKRDDGIRQLRKLLVLEPTNGDAQFALAEALTEGEQAQAAEREWRRMVALQPKRSAAWTNLGAVLAKRGEYDEAEQALVRAAELDPVSATFRINLGELRYRRARMSAEAGESKEAERHLRGALQAAPGLRERARKDALLAPLLPATAAR